MRTGERVRASVKGCTPGIQVSDYVSCSLEFWPGEKIGAPISAPHLPHTQAFCGATQTPSWARLHAVIATSESRVRSGFLGPQPLSSLPLIKPESLLGQQGKVKVLGSTSFLRGRLIEMGEGSCGMGSFLALTSLIRVWGLPHERRNRSEDRLGLKLGINRLTSWVLGFENRIALVSAA